MVLSSMMSNCVFKTILCMLALFKLVLMCSLHLHINDLSYMSNVDCGSPCNTCMVIVGFGVTNALTMLLHLAHWLISFHNVATRWIRHNFDASVCFDGCNNISEILERSQHIRTNARLTKTRISDGFSHRVHRVLVHFT